MTNPMDDLRQASADVSGIELNQQLSPAAYNVLTAVTLKKYDVPPEGLPAFAEEMAPLIAVALRAAADQLAGEMTVIDEGFKGVTRNELSIIYVEDLLAIAAELEGTNA
jgi:hypothetical protein